MQRLSEFLKSFHKLSLKFRFFQMENYKTSGGCSCNVDNFMEILRNESVKEILRGPPGQNGLPGLTVSFIVLDFHLKAALSKHVSRKKYANGRLHSVTLISSSASHNFRGPRVCLESAVFQD